MFLRDVVRTLCFFFSSLFTLVCCISVLWPFYYIHCTLFLYIWWWCMFHSSTSTCVVSFLSLYTCFFMYAIFIFVLHIIHWWVLFKCFKKTGCKSLPYHKLSSCKVFQEFMLELDLFCNSTSGYEFSDLRLLSWFICLLWFCHGLPNGKIVRDILYVVG